MDDIVEIHLNVPSGSRPWLFCEWEKRQSSKAAPPSLHQGKRVEKFTPKHPALVSVSGALSPANASAGNTESSSWDWWGNPEKAEKWEITAENNSTAQTGWRFWQPQREIWMNAELQEWLGGVQHLQGKEILHKSQQMCAFLPYQPHYKALVPSELLYTTLLRTETQTHFCSRLNSHS